MITALAHVSPHTGYVYPNETIVPWGILIVFYPYVTGLVAGSFTVSSLYHVFGVKSLKPVARFALLTSLCFMIFVPTFLLSHLGHPERAFNAVITPHWTSAFATFGYIASFYVGILILEIWFAFRADLVARLRRSRGIRKMFYTLLCLGSDDIGEAAMRADRKWIWGLAMLGIPGAHILHGYVGFVFGSLKSREWWASDLMPAIFLGSAIISGIAILILLYCLACRWRNEEADLQALRTLCYTMWGFLIFTLVLEFLEFINVVYKSREGIDAIYALIRGPISAGVAVQIGTSLLALLVLGWLIHRRKTDRTLKNSLILVSLLILVAVFAMRWNVVIGGQELSKTMAGLIQYTLPVWGHEGILWALFLFAMPFVLLFLLCRWIPPWDENHHIAD